MNQNNNKFQLPLSWALVRLGELVHSEKGKKPKHSSSIPTSEFSLPYVDIEAFESGILKTWTNGERCTLCNENDFLMVWDGARSGLVGRGIKGALGSTLVKISFSQISNDYAYYFLKSKFLEINTRAKGSGTPHVDPDLLWNYDFPLPPLNEQKRIVTKIEELFSEIDKGVESLLKAQELLTAYRQAILKNAFEGKFTEKWREKNNGKCNKWQKKSLISLTSFITSGSRGWAKYYSESGEIFIRAQNLKYDRLDIADVAYVNIPSNIEGTRTKIRKNDLLITITGANVTKTAIVDHEIENAYVSQHVALCRPIQTVSPKYLYWYIIAESAGRKQLSNLAYGAGKPGLNLDNIRNIQIDIPGYEEQVVVAAIIEENLKSTNWILEYLKAELSRAEMLCQGVLKKAFSGELVSQDATDESANTLLKLIKPEKEVLRTQNKKSKQRQKITV